MTRDGVTRVMRHHGTSILRLLRKMLV